MCSIYIYETNMENLSYNTVNLFKGVFIQCIVYVVNVAINVVLPITSISIRQIPPTHFTYIICRYVMVGNALFVRAFGYMCLN